MVDSRFLSLLNSFKRRFFHNFGKDRIPYAIQTRDDQGTVGYDFRKNETLTDQLIIQHFLQEPIRTSPKYERASLAIPGDWDVTKWICIDADEEWQIAVANDILMPALDNYGIEYIIGTSRSDRLHIWIMTNIMPETAEKFMLQLFHECGQKYRDWEIYPCFARRKAAIRMEGGYHFKASQASPVRFRGKESSDPYFIMESFCEAHQYAEHEIQGMLKFLPPEATPTVKKRRAREKFQYIPLNLPVKVEGLPKYVHTVASNCQVYNQMVNGIIEEDLIEKKGIPHHNAGLCLAGLFKFSDHVDRTTDGARRFDELKKEYRSRSALEHQWDTRKVDNPAKLAWSCQTLDRYFGMCDGCPFKGRQELDNPKQFYWGEKVESTIVGSVTEISDDELDTEENISVSFKFGS